MITRTPIVDTWLTVPEVAKMLAVSKQTVRRLIADNQLRHIRVGHVFRISELGLAHWVAKGGTDSNWSLDIDRKDQRAR